MTRSARIVLPIVILMTGIATTWLLVSLKPEVERTEPEASPPLVRVLAVERRPVALSVVAHGSVEPRTRTELVAQVAGQVTRISPSLVAGGFFDEGEVLVEIDPRDHELARVRAGSQVAQAEARLAREEAEAEAARSEWRAMGSGGSPPPLVVREPQLLEARASLEAARASLEQAELDLERTRVRAPYAGRVSSKRADVGQFVSRGTPIAGIYSIDFAEIRPAGGRPGALASGARLRPRVRAALRSRGDAPGPVRGCGAHVVGPHRSRGG